MIILGLDPGSLKTGFGVLRKSSEATVVHVAHGCIVLDKQKTIAERVHDLAQDLIQIIATYKPQVAVVEEIFCAKNARSALILGQARGALLAVLGLHGVKIHALSPTSVKSLTTGHGHAPKFQVAAMVASELNVSIPKSQDASDALALALAFGRML